MEHYYLSYERFVEVSYHLLQDIKNAGHEYQAIFCPLKGGFFLSYFMSKHLNLPIRYMEISSYTGKNQGDFYIGIKPKLDRGKYLLCDDIYDSGKTIRKIIDIYADIDFDIACVLSKCPNETKDYFVGDVISKEIWVDFYWELM